MGVLVLIIIITIFIFINIKIANFKDRATQQMLKNTGISSSDINAEITNGFEKKHIKFLEKHSQYTEESIKDLLKQYTVQIFNKNSINEFSDFVYEKMQKDTKLGKMKDMKFKRVNIMKYSENEKLDAIVVYTDNRDEYNVFLNCSILGNKIQLDKYQISKGSVVGF